MLNHALFPLAFIAHAATAERFSEHLELKNLPDGRVSALFTFTTTRDSSHPAGRQHYTLFPLALGQLLDLNSVSELHLALNAGQWDYDSWGTPDEQSVGSGAELWTWIRASNATEVDLRWSSLRHALAGLFCASLTAMDNSRTTVPGLSFAPSVALPVGPHQLRYATLPAEHVCTENLTPFVKLLPCKAHAGLASLLNPHALFSAPFHGLSIQFSGDTLHLSLQSVLTPESAVSSLKDLLDRSIPGPCTVASSSAISITSASGFQHFDLTAQSFPFNIALPSTGKQRPHVPTAPLSVRRWLTGSAQHTGGLAVQLQNNSNDTLSVTYMDVLPWFVTPYLHTLDVRLGAEARPDLVESLSYTPAAGHSRAPATLEAVLRLPPGERVTLACRLERAFLLIGQHPPDAQRGWDLPPAVVSLPNSAGRLYTKTLLVDLPTPDFSMPYNVIMLSSALIGHFFFIRIFRLLTGAL
ncbi:Gpi16 subunit, GPI transamidase component [Auricularia subglabra TFB-10046 SS5]|nr:Gpi16 subunit, GPI transamidase component [Auricularia subglabra TFB-10046 SS5]